MFFPYKKENFLTKIKIPLSNVTAITIFDGRVHVFMKKNTLSSGKITIVILPEKSIPLFHKSMNFPLVRRYIRMPFSIR
jgi:hypothetical protein